MIDKVATSCTGCGACIARCPFDAIRYKISDNLFYYPEIDANKCTRCNLCEKVCPAIAETATITNDLGESFAAWASNKPSESSSGGSFFSIAKSFISNRGIVYGAKTSEDMSVRHVRVSEISLLHELSGSKYVQSIVDPDIYISIENDLKDGKQVLFSGTPCQVAGVKLYLKKYYNNLFTLDLVCHGVPSPIVFSDYIKYCAKIRRHKITGFLCRDNRKGWDNLFKSTIYYSNSKEEYNTPLANLWNRIFFSEFITRQSCNTCKFAKRKRVGDITLGDFWGIKSLPENVRNNGVSLLICNTAKGQQLLADSNLTFIRSNTNEKEHPNLYHPTPVNPESTEFQRYYKENGFSKTIKKYFGFSAWLDFKIRIYSIITNIIKL